MSSRRCSPPVRRSSAAAAGRRPRTSRRCGRPSTSSRRRRLSKRPHGADRRCRSPRCSRHASGRRWRRAATHGPGPAAGRGSLRRVGRDRPAALGPDRPDDRGRAAPPRCRRGPRQHQRQRDGPGPDGLPGRRVRHPARPRPRVPGPLHDPRPEPHGARVGAARRPRARRAEHPGAHRRSAADRRLPHRDRRLGRRLDRPGRDPRPAQPRRGRRRLADRPAGRLHDRLRPRSHRRRRDDGVGPPRAQARRRRAPRDDPAALLVGQVEAMLAEARRRFGPRGFPVPVLLGILPLQSGRHAEFLHNEVPGITIPDDVRAAMAAAGDRGAEVGLGTGARSAGDGRAARCRHVRDAELRPVRTGGRAGPVRRIRAIPAGNAGLVAGER